MAAGPSKKRKRAAAPPPPPPQGTGAGTGYGSGSNYALGFGFGGGPASTSNGTGYAYDAYDHDEFYSDEDDNEFGYGLGYGYGFGSGSEDDDSDDDPVAGGGYNPADYTDEESFYEAMEAKIKEAKKANSKAAATGKAKGKGKGEAKDGAPSDKGKGKGNGKGGSKANGGTAADQKAGTSKQQQKKKKKKAECEPDQPVEMTAKVARDAAQDRIYLAALRIATSLLPEPDSPSARMYDFLPHPTLAALLELSTLPDLLALLLRNDSVPEWQRRSDVYFAMLDLLRSFGGCEATLGLLFGPRREKRFSDGIGAWMRAARGGDGGGGEVAWAYEAGDESAAVVATAAGMASKGKGKGKAPARGKKRKAAEAIGQEAAESQSEQQGDKGKVVLASPLYSLLKKLLIQAHAFRRAASSSNEFDDADVALLGICGDFAAAGERFVATELVWKERDRRDQRAMLMVEAAPEEAGDDQVGSKVEEAGMATRTRGRKGKDKGREERIWTEREYVKACEELAYGAVELDVKQHHYSREIAESATSRRPHGSFVHLAKELAVLSTSLPPGIWVRHDEERVDVLKCLLAGPEHSPYAGGLFEFDIFLPLRYPEVSPLCWLVTTGGNRVRFNPNLYAEGKVCLSLLGTWSGTPEEMWQPNKSTILQVLLSITSMILGTNYPFYNEPGFGAPRDDERNQIYNKNVSLATARWAILDWIDGDKYKGSIWADVIASHFLLRRSQVLATVKEWAKLDARLHAWLPQHDKCAGTHHLTPYGSLYVSPWNADGTQKTEAELEKERDKLRKADEQGKRDLVVEIERALKKLEGWKGAGTATAEWLDKLSTDDRRNSSEGHGADSKDGSNTGGHHKAKRGGVRDKLPGIFKGPIDAFFPKFTPSPLYDSAPEFIVRANDRSKWRARKIYVRTCVVFLGNMILMLEQKSLLVLGNAGFFGLIVAAMLPPMFPVQLFLIVTAMLVLGMCLGWAWGSAGMAAALRARSQVLLASQVRTVEGSVSAATNPDSAYRRQIFEGAFLDWRSTVVFGVFLGTGAFFFGLLRAKRPKLMLLAIFGTIVLDVMTAYGPLFPIKQYTLATTFLIPTGCYVGIALAATILIFPQTLNHAWTVDLTDKFLSPTRQRGDLHSKILSTPPVTLETTDIQTHPWTKLGEMWQSTQEAMSNGLEGLLGSIGLAELEVSFGHLGAKDLKSLVDPLRELHMRSLGLAGMWSTVWTRVRRHQEENEDEVADAQLDEHKQEPPARRGQGHHLNMRNKLHEAEVRNQHDFPTLLKLFADVSGAMRRADDAAIAAAMDWLSAQNNARWCWIYSKKARADEQARLAELQDAVRTLETEIAEFRSYHRLRIVEPFRDFFDAETGRLISQAERRKRGGYSARERLFAPGSLFTILSASDTLVMYSQSVLKFTDKLATLAQQRRASRLWFPTGLRKVGHLLAGHHRGPSSVGPNFAAGGQDPDRVDEESLDDEDASDDATLSSRRDRAAVDEQSSTEKSKQGSKKKRKGKKSENPFDKLMKSENRNPDAKPPRNALQRVGLVGYRFLNWWTTPDVIFALKYAAASVVLWLPQVFRTTAFLMYSEKVCRPLHSLAALVDADASAPRQLLWAQITAQTFMAPYAGDQVFTTIQRIFGTAIGLVYGMLLWYIGAAKGRGTSVGVGSSLFVFMLPLLAMRLHAPPASAMIAIMVTVTTVLIVGYSIIDTRLATLANPGVGYNVAWRRGLLVIIGAAVGLVFMILPPANSTRRLVRRTHAKCLEQLGRVYAAITTLWVEEQRLADRGRGGSKHDQSFDSATKAGTAVDAAAPFGQASQKAAMARMFAIRNKLNSTKVANLQASFELTLRGDWPQAEYFRLLRLQLALLQALGQLGLALARLEPNWRKQLVHETAFLNQPLVADVTSTFTMISLALRQGCSLPAAMPGPLLDRLIYHDGRLRAFSRSLMRDSNGTGTDDDAADSESHATKMEGARVGDFKLTYETLCDERFSVYASALEALSNVLLDVDALELAAKALLGEIQFPGYSMLADRNHYGDV
ncbi:hypothetical protein JCM3774_004770 [Rhodotorula dairenensis]